MCRFWAVLNILLLAAAVRAGQIVQVGEALVA
jgi:hypothetical protein